MILFVEGADWLCSLHFPTGCRDFLIGRIRVSASDDVLNHRAAVVTFSDNAVGVELAVGIDRNATPAGGR